jgi:hypothetical protein
MSALGNVLISPMGALLVLPNRVSVNTGACEIYAVL